MNDTFLNKTLLQKRQTEIERMEKNGQKERNNKNIFARWTFSNIKRSIEENVILSFTRSHTFSSYTLKCQTTKAIEREIVQ